jgi:membrane-associated phospholipid phosphatase
MSQIPPPSGPPTPQFEGYYRQPTGPSKQQLKDLAEGYFGLSIIFVANIGLAVFLNIVARSTENIAVPLTGIGIMFLAITFATLPKNRLIARGKGWPDGHAVLASVLMGLNSALCCGIIGYVVMQSIAANELKRSGIKMGFFARKQAIMDQIDSLPN